MNSKLIVALDVDTWPKAKKLVDALCPAVKIFKVGSQLFTGCGPEAVKYIREKGGEVFLDLKFHDIPNTVASAVIAAVRLNVFMLTLHSCGGLEMMKNAKDAAEFEAKSTGQRRPLIVAVTILTSRESTPEDVLRLAQEGLSCGLDGVVCSVHEAAYLRKSIQKEFIIVTPGIRPGGCDVNDQKRVATVDEAVKSGSNFLVVGRPIVAARDPVLAAQEILKEMHLE